MDAEAAARGFLAGTTTITPKRRSDQVEMIRLLKVAKDSEIDGRTRALNQVRSLLVTAPVTLRERLKGISRSELIATCASFRPGVLDGPMAAAKRALRSLALRIQTVDTELEALMSDLDALTQEACPGLRQSYGIGVDGAATLLTAVGDNPECLTIYRSITCWDAASSSSSHGMSSASLIQRLSPESLPPNGRKKSSNES